MYVVRKHLPLAALAEKACFGAGGRRNAPERIAALKRYMYAVAGCATNRITVHNCVRRTQVQEEALGIQRRLRFLGTTLRSSSVAAGAVIVGIIVVAICGRWCCDGRLGRRLGLDVFHCLISGH